MPFHNLFRFSFLVLSSIGFSLGLLYARLIGDVEALSEVIRLQSFVVFLSFFLQLGYRAAIRKYIYNYRLRAAKFMESFLYLFLLFCSAIGLAFEYQLDSYYFICLSSLLAWLTFKFTVAVAMKKDGSLVFFGVLVFLCALIPSLLMSLINWPFDQFYLILEFTSVVLLLFFMFFGGFRKGLLSKRRFVFGTLVESHYYQIGSGVVYLVVFLVAQAVLLGGYDISFLAAYADVQILSGLFALLVTKLLLLYEKKIFCDAAVRLKVYVFLVVLVLCSVVSVAVFLSLINGSDFLFLLAVSFIVFSRPVMGYVVQYLMCFNFNLLMTALFICLLGLYGFADIGRVGIWFLILPVSVFYVYAFLAFSRPGYKG